jgi:hypothetical protein
VLAVTAVADVDVGVRCAVRRAKEFDVAALSDLYEDLGL